MQVTERWALGTVAGYCWGCGHYQEIDARSCLCPACTARWTERQPAGAPVRYDLDGTVISYVLTA